MVESLNYTSDALIEKFYKKNPKRISIEQCNEYGRKPGQKANQEQIANILYGGDFGKKELGNIKPGDGWLFRGSGPIQITGRKNVEDFTNYYNKKFQKNLTPEEIASKLRTDMEIGVHSACWFFAIAKNLIPLSVSDNMKAIVKKINGGFFGLNERNKYYELCKKYIL